MIKYYGNDPLRKLDISQLLILLSGDDVKIFDERLIDGRFNLLLLSTLDDNNPRKCIRVISSPTLRENLQKILESLGFKNLFEQVNFLQSLTPFNVKSETVKSWLKGANPPLITIKNLLSSLEKFGFSDKETDIFLGMINDIRHIKPFSSSQHIIFPIEFSPELLHLVGVIIGDGSLSVIKLKNRHHFRIIIEKANQFFIQDILQSTFQKLFNVTGCVTHTKRENKKEIHWRLVISSKSILFFFNIFFDIPIGKKSHIVRMPELIRNLKPVERIPFIVGLMDTDWGHHGGGFGTGTASHQLLKDTVETLEILLNARIHIRKEPHASFCFLKGERLKNLNSLINNTFPLRNPKRIETINKLLKIAP